MKRPDDRYNCDEELGKRLRECRLKAGLTQQKLATAMGRQGKGSHHVAGRLERGEVPNPGVGLLADYLRGCRASFADILNVLDRYTKRESVIEVEVGRALAKVTESLPAEVDRAVERFDRGVVRRAERQQVPPPEPEVRVRRARNFGRSQVWAKRVRRQVVSIIETMDLRPGPMNEQHLQNYAAKVWRVLNRTRGKSEEKREALLEAAARPYAFEGGPEPEHLQAIRQGLQSFFHDAEKTGALDAAPQLVSSEDQSKGGFRVRPDTRPQRAAWNKAREALVEQLRQEVSRMPELAAVDPRLLPLLHRAVRQLCSIGDHYPPGSDVCRKRVEELATEEYFVRLGRDPALVRRLAEIVIPRWEEMRSALGPHPLGHVRPPR